MTQTTSLTQSIGIVLVLALVGLMLAVSAGAADTGTVAATVTPQIVSVSVASGTVDYGVLDLSASANTFVLGQQQIATNDSNVAVDLDIKSSDAVGGTPWNLAASVGGDEFTHEFSAADDGTSWTGFNVDNAIYSSLATDVIVDANQVFDLKIGTPNSSSDTEVKTITVTVLAKAS